MALIHCDFFSPVLDLSTSMTVILPQPATSNLRRNMNWRQRGRGGGNRSRQGRDWIGWSGRTGRDQNDQSGCPGGPPEAIFEQEIAQGPQDNTVEQKQVSQEGKLLPQFPL